MSKPGQLFAKPPKSPYPNLTAVERIGTTKSQDSIWRAVCTCGATFSAVGHGFRTGQTKCSRCNPSLGDAQAIEILMLLPATHEALARKLGVNIFTMKSRLRKLKKNGLCHTGRWRRPSGMGSFQPVIVAGPGEDAPCALEARSNADHKRKYRKRISAAIAKADAGGKEDPRYMRHIALHMAKKTAKQSRAQPQTPFSALFAIAGRDSHA
jgi:hypothetical protein